MEEQIDLSQVKGVESQSVDLWEFDKKEVTIESLNVEQVNSQYTPMIGDTNGHQKQWVLKISSEVLTSIGEGEDKIEFRASELFNLVQTKEGKLIGFPKGTGSNLFKFLKDLRLDPEKLENLEEVVESLKGKKAIVKAFDKEVDGNKKTYLKFRY